MPLDQPPIVASPDAEGWLRRHEHPGGWIVAESPAQYKARHPERTAFYRLFETRFDNYLRSYEERFEPRAGPLRPVVARSVEQFLSCGRLQGGFARIRCPKCRAEHLLAFSCRTRNFCASCQAKRSVQFAEKLSADILASVPHRHWTFSLPRVLRGLFEREEERRAVGKRFFFCQQEAVETVVYLSEVQGKRKMPETGDLLRYALKLATGTGKTLVMALFVAWATLHKRKVSGSSLSANFLVLVPNLTVRDRVSGQPRGDGLDPAGEHNLYEAFEIVPPEYREEFHPNVRVRNWQGIPLEANREDWIGEGEMPIEEGRFIPQAVLRNMVNTVGSKAKPGEHVRCIVSVNMLSEGWDVKSVTHILGLRAFGSPLLTEQIIGRGLRRTNYDLLNQPLEERAEGSEETVDAFGIPFVGFPVEKRKRPKAGEWGRKPIWIEPDAKKQKFRVRVPNVRSWAVGVTESLADLLRVEDLPRIEINPRETPPDVQVRPVVGGAFTVKRYSSEKETSDEGGWRHAKVVLSPVNPEYDPIVLTRDDAQQVEVLAEFVTVLRGS